MFQELLDYRAPEFAGSDLIAPILGHVHLRLRRRAVPRGRASHEVRARTPGMMLLIGLAISVAFVASVATEFGAFDLDFWWELAALITIMLLGHWQEMKAIGQASGALAALAELLPDDAERVSDAGIETVLVSGLRSRRCRLGASRRTRPGGRDSDRRICRCRRVDAHGRVASGHEVGGIRCGRGHRGHRFLDPSTCGGRGGEHNACRHPTTGRRSSNIADARPSLSPIVQPHSFSMWRPLRGSSRSSSGPRLVILEPLSSERSRFSLSLARTRWGLRSHW